MAQPVAHTPPGLVRRLDMTFPGAVQTIAALEARIEWARSSGEDWAAADAHAALVAVREAFDLWPRPVSEARDDTTPQLLMYQAEGR